MLCNCDKCESFGSLVELETLNMILINVYVMQWNGCHLTDLSILLNMESHLNENCGIEHLKHNNNNGREKQITN